MFYITLSEAKLYTLIINSSYPGYVDIYLSYVTFLSYITIRLQNSNLILYNTLAQQSQLFRI